jgi:type II secretory pathway component GspD/PulD (secretin)
MEPVFKPLSPLDSERLTLSLKDEDFRDLLRLIAHETGLNLIIQKEVERLVPEDKRHISAEFHEMTLREVLEAVLGTLGLGYEIRNGVLYVQAYQEKIFDLSFLFTLRGTQFDLGGDVLGGQGSNQGISAEGGEEEVISPIKGNFELSGESLGEGRNIYQLLEENLKQLLSEEGRMSLNPMTGTLWVLDRVPNVKRIERYVQDLEERYGKQVLIETKMAISPNKTFKQPWKITTFLILSKILTL